MGWWVHTILTGYNHRDICRWLQCLLTLIPGPSWTAIFVALHLLYCPNCHGCLNHLNFLKIMATDNKINHDYYCFYLMIIQSFYEILSHVFCNKSKVPILRSWYHLLYSITTWLISTCKHPCGSMGGFVAYCLIGHYIMVI